MGQVSNHGFYVRYSDEFTTSATVPTFTTGERSLELVPPREEGETEISYRMLRNTIIDLFSEVVDSVHEEKKLTIKRAQRKADKEAKELSESNENMRRNLRREGWSEEKINTYFGDRGGPDAENNQEEQVLEAD
jgi:BRCT domain type II-containing protein